VTTRCLLQEEFQEANALHRCNEASERQTSSSSLACTERNKENPETPQETAEQGAQHHTLTDTDPNVAPRVVSGVLQADTTTDGRPEHSGQKERHHEHFLDLSSVPDQAKSSVRDQRAMLKHVRLSCP